jgi:hypothetical protein
MKQADESGDNDPVRELQQYYRQQRGKIKHTGPGKAKRSEKRIRDLAQEPDQLVMRVNRQPGNDEPGKNQQNEQFKKPMHQLYQ